MIVASLASGITCLLKLDSLCISNQSKEVWINYWEVLLRF